jgi:type IV secretory pathway VirB10-like protein
MKKKLPVVGKPTPAHAQKGLAVTPVKGASRPEFPTRSEAYLKAGLFGGAALLAGCGSPSHATTTPPPAQPVAAAPAPAPAPAPTPAAQPEMAAAPAANPPAQPPVPEKPAMAKLPDGSIDGNELDKQQPKFKVYREGGGIGPAEDMWEPNEVEAYIAWQMAKEGKLNLQTQYKLDADGVQLELDAFDPDKKIGFLYVDKFEGGSDSISTDTRSRIDSLMKEKKAAILLIDQKKNPDAATLKGKILKFMAAVKKAPPTAQ